ncbi:MAG: S-layer homology domain-containing protein [Calothrix sp. SM1_7_51]|nr:S-layer homology domain-containing protein [Calothrix sp. SM1_7_51]
MHKFISIVSLLTLLQTFTLNGYVIAQTPTENISRISRGINDAIQEVVTAKWMTNFADGKFYPERLISRAELAVIMVKAFGLDKRTVKPENLVIPDVPTSHWAYREIQLVLKTDIMRGYRDNMFFPNQRINRAEALAIFAQAYGVFQFPEDTVTELLLPYPDAKNIPSWGRKAIATVVAEGFVNTDDKGNLLPLQPMTRGDMAFVLSQYLQRKQRQPDTPIAPDAPQQ